MCMGIVITEKVHTHYIPEYLHKVTTIIILLQALLNILEAKCNLRIYSTSELACWHTRDDHCWKLKPSHNTSATMCRIFRSDEIRWHAHVHVGALGLIYCDNVHGCLWDRWHPRAWIWSLLAAPCLWTETRSWWSTCPSIPMDNTQLVTAQYY